MGLDIFTYAAAKKAAKQYHDEHSGGSAMLVGTVKGGTSVLPTAYQEVEYISSGTVRDSDHTFLIDTGVKSGLSSRFEIDFALNNTSVTDQCLFGSWNESATTHLLWYNSKIYTCLNSPRSQEIAVAWPGGVDMYRHTVVFDATTGAATFDGSALTTQLGVSPCAENLGLFGRIGRSGVFSALMKCYSFKVYEDGAAVRDMVPCYRTTDGTVGMYDTVNGMFYMNSGMGTFTKGADSGGGTFPTARPDGTALEVGDFVKPAADAVFPFTIDGITFSSKNDQAVFAGGTNWLYNANPFQKTSETPVADKAAESISGTAVYQSDVNKELVKASAGYVFEQTSASNSWDIAHNMGKYPTVLVIDSAGNVCAGDITYIDKNNLTLAFSAAFSGKAYLS